MKLGFKVFLSKLLKNKIRIQASPTFNIKISSSHIFGAMVILQVYVLVGCGGGAKAGVQVSRREFHIHIHLDYDRAEFLSCIKKKKKIKISSPRAWF